MDEREFEQHRLVLEEVELLPRDRRACLEVREIQRLGKGDVILWLEVELARFAPFLDDLVVFGQRPDRCVGMGHVGDGADDGP